MMPEPRYGPEWLHEKIVAGHLVIIDGAMGTELQARGVPMHGKLWSATAMLSHYDDVRAAHADYIEAGAEVIITNTFAAGPHLLGKTGLGDQMERINRRAVEAARAARDDVAEVPVAIAGSMHAWIEPHDSIDAARLGGEFRRHADLLAEAGVDLVALEMCERPDYTVLMIEAALATGLAVWLGMSCRRSKATGNMNGRIDPNVDLARSVAELAQTGVGVINVMHTEISDTAAALALVRDYWSGPMGVYPESGYMQMPNWQFIDIVEPDDLVREMQSWVASGVQIIGGCCGLGPSHIRALKTAFVGPVQAAPR